MSEFKNIVILTGAGISAESGIETFRASDGLWEGQNVEDVATPEGFARNPALVQQFYNERRAQLNSGTVDPNPAHNALAALEAGFTGKFLLVTQNVDNLHERSGTKNLIHMHGELNKIHCSACMEVSECTTDVDHINQCTSCGSANTLRPDIVWFGEMPMLMEEIYLELENCDLFISIGTSGNVYPAAGFVQTAKSAGAHTVELNLERSVVNHYFNESINGPASEIVPAYVKQLLG
uniref:NAD-dependent protein deacylase n=1 Tax=uncultured Thiotrichaceae bacterium TaxID=298394 RepID=A0A6S6UMD2_9GAMM|nr:MAG: NAD-dependent protein deacetylase of SIR2 family [uncultured Thiotrichaceae bacterium]